MTENSEEKIEESNKVKGEHDRPVVLYALVLIALGLAAFNQYQIMSITGAYSGGKITGFFMEEKDISNIDLSTIKGTGYAIADLFPVENINTEQDAVDVMISTGTPEYGSQLGVSFDDPVNSLNTLVNKYRTLKEDVKNNYPDIWQRYLNLATKPVGISCEFCCGVGAVGIDSNGDIICGCSHNPASHALTLWLMKNTEYTDAEIVREVLKWKTLWFPKDMVSLAMKVAGGDTSKLQLPGMVGGC